MFAKPEASRNRYGPLRPLVSVPINALKSIFTELLGLQPKPTTLHRNRRSQRKIAADKADFFRLTDL